MLGFLAPGASATLAPSKENPRYFSDPNGKLVYLTGSHTWTNFQDVTINRQLHAQNYPEYLQLLETNGHNFIRLWTWEHLSYSPHIYMRTGPGAAIDGKPRFDLNALNQVYFDRLRKRVKLAAERNIYVSVMLFQGWSIQHKVEETPDHRFGGNPWPEHPFHKANNINGINGDLNENGEGEEVHQLLSEEILDLQLIYVEKMVDTLNDLPNVLWEVSNESTNYSVEWQKKIVSAVQQLESKLPLQHPIGMTTSGGVNEKIDNCTLLSSGADWVSPREQFFQNYMDDVPAADGQKVMLLDTDHLWGVGGGHSWVWKSFLRGMNPIYMDPITSPNVLFPNDSLDLFKSARQAMGQTRHYASKMNLAEMRPIIRRGSTTGFMLANPGEEYLVYQPEAGRSFTVYLNAGEYLKEWFNPKTGIREPTRTIDLVRVPAVFRAPFEGEAILYLKKRR